MDIKEKISEIVEVVNKDPEFAEKFRSDPVGAVRTVTGIDISESQVNQIIEAVKAKISVDKAGDIIGKSKGLFTSEGKGFFK